VKLNIHITTIDLLFVIFFQAILHPFRFSEIRELSFRISIMKGGSVLEKPEKLTVNHRSTRQICSVSYIFRFIYESFIRVANLKFVFVLACRFGDRLAKFIFSKRS